MLIQRLKSLQDNKSAQGYVLSFFIGGLLLIHLLTSDVVVAGKHDDQQSPSAAASTEEKEAVQRLTLVEVQQVNAVQIQKELQLYGRTEANRIARIKSELDGSVVQILGDEGQRIKKGDSLVRLQTNGLDERLKHGQALVEQRHLEYQSSQKLQQKGFQARLQLAEKATQLANAQAQLAQLNKEYEDSQVKVPFDGLLNTVFVEQGDYLQNGDVIGQILDLNPLIVKVYVPETEVRSLAKGQKAHVEFLDGEQRDAHVSYISANSMSGTNTFVVELSLPNDDFLLPAGISSKVTLFTEKVAATPVSPSFLTLDEDGRSGIYIVENNTAHFKAANILKSTAQQLWVESVGDEAQIIIAGHQSVLEGTMVEVMTDQSSVEQSMANL